MSEQLGCRLTAIYQGIELTPSALLMVYWPLYERTPQSLELRRQLGHAVLVQMSIVPLPNQIGDTLVGMVSDR